MELTGGGEGVEEWSCFCSIFAEPRSDSSDEVTLPTKLLYIDVTRE